jgi:predicted dehydrogenase
MSIQRRTEMTTRTPLGVGLISVGWMGRLHARSYLAAGQHYPDLTYAPRLVVAADPDAGGREYATDVLGFDRAVADYSEVLADPEVDVVSICSPNFLHHEIALAAIEAGKPFWIEKPMGRGAVESREIAERAESAGLVTSVGFNYRHVPAVARARELVRSGAIGTITNVRVSFLADYSADPAGALTWRFLTARAGSGVLGDLLSHGADLGSGCRQPLLEGFRGRPPRRRRERGLRRTSRAIRGRRRRCARVQPRRDRSACRVRARGVRHQGLPAVGLPAPE